MAPTEILAQQHFNNFVNCLFGEVFTENATFGYSSMGKFFGFKLHLVIDLNGNIINASITPANVDDRGPVESLLKQFKGTIFGDKGYISNSKFAQKSGKVDYSN